jgi:hypothetical protein
MRTALIALAILLAPPGLAWLARLGLRSGRGKGRAGGLALGLSLAFAGFFDPARKEAMEHIDRRREAAAEEAVAAGEE